MQKYTPLEGNKTNVVNTAQAMMGLIMGGQVSETQPALILMTYIYLYLYTPSVPKIKIF